MKQLFLIIASVKKTPQDNPNINTEINKDKNSLPNIPLPTPNSHSLYSPNHQPDN